MALRRYLAKYHINQNAENFVEAIKLFYVDLNSLGLQEEIITKIFALSKEVTETVFNFVSEKNNEVSVEDNTIFVAQMFKTYSSKYKRHKVYENYVEPKRMSVGYRWDVRFNPISNVYNRVLIQNTFQFVRISVPWEKVFKNFLNHFKEFNSI